jgi:hypothetical protein
MSAKPVDLTKLKPDMRCRMTDGSTPVCESCEFDEDRGWFYVTWTTEIIGNRAWEAVTFSWWYLPDGKWQTVTGVGNNIEEILDPDDTITADFIAAIPEMEKEAATITERYISLGSFQDVGSAFTYLSKEREAVQQEPGENGKALRLNNGKIDSTNIHPAMLWPLYRVGHFGSKKYAKNNYLKGGKPASEYVASARRHLDLAASGEKVDPEGCDHLAHAAWNCLFLLMCQNFGMLGEDDLPPPVDFEILRKLMRE